MKFSLSAFTRHKVLLDLFFLLIIFVLTYWLVPSIFFQQDEWRGFGLMVAEGASSIVANFGNSSFHFIPVNLSLAYLIFKLFHLNYIAYNLVGLTIHFINGLLVFKIAQYLFDKKQFAFVAATIFISSSIPAQLVMWPVVSLSTLSLTFMLLSLLIVLKYQKSSKWMLIAVVCILFALLTLEYTVGLLICLPLILLILRGRKFTRNTFYSMTPFILVGFVYLVLRLYPHLIYYSSDGSGYSFQLSVIGYKFSRLPLRYLGQLFVPEELVLSSAKFFSNKFFLEETILFTKITTIIGALILFGSLFVYQLAKTFNYKYRRNLLIILLFMLTNSIPFIFLPGKAGDFALFPPRYLYHGIAGSALFFTLIFQLSLFKKIQWPRILTVILIVGTILSGISLNWMRGNKLYQEGQIRLHILRTIKNSYSKLPSRVVFYTESDNSYYGLPETELILPFQSGLGQTLLVWYQEKEKFPKEFFQDEFLWEITEQGYKEVGERGFGYFRDFELLKNVIKQYNIPLDSVISFSWYSKSQSLINTTDQIQNQLKSDLIK